MKITAYIISFLVLQSTLAYSKKPPVRQVKQILPSTSQVNKVGNKTVDVQSGIPTHIAHVEFQAKSQDAEAIAREYLMSHLNQFKLQTQHVEELQLSYIHRGLATTTVRFKQYFQGIEVFNSEFTVSFNKENVVNFVTNQLKPLTGLKQFKSKFSKEDAMQIALAYMNSDFESKQSRVSPVIYKKESLVSAYKVELTSNTMQGNWLFIIDAQNGKILMAKDINMYQNASGTVFDPDPLSSSGSVYGGNYSDNNDSTNQQLNAELFSKNFQLDTSGSTFLLQSNWAQSVDISPPNDGIFSQNSSTFNYNRADAAFESVNVFYHIDNFLNYLNNDLGLNVKPYQYNGGVKYDAHGDNGNDNSFYNSGNGALVFGEGCIDDAEDADVIIHELGHGIHDWITRGGLSQENGLSEGTGDYFAQSYSRSRSNQIWQSNQAAHHYVFSWDGHNECWSGRTTNYGAQYPSGLVGQIHTDGQIWASCLMKVWDQIGRENTDKIVIEGLSMTGSTTNQQQAAEAVLQAASNLGLNQHLQTIENTFTSCGYDVTAQSSFNLQLSHSGNSTTANKQTFSVTATGGVAPYTYDWDINDDGNTDGTLSSISVNYQQAYSGKIKVTAKDSQNFTASTELSVSILAPQINLLNVAAVPTPEQVCGNNDSFIDPGERWRIPVTFQNNGFTSTQNAHAVFTKSAGLSSFVAKASDNFGNKIGACDRQFIDISSTGNVLALAASSTSFSANDEGVATVNLSQPFDLYGRTINAVYLSTNGYISTSPDESGFDWDNDCPLPQLPNNSGNGSTPNARLLPMHDDLITQKIIHQHFNTCPRPSLLGADLSCDVFMYQGVDRFDNDDPTVENFNFEAILYPTVNQWVYQYDGVGFKPSSLSVGLQSDNASDGMSYSCNTDNGINTQEAVCLFHKDNLAGGNDDSSFFNLETPTLAIGSLQVSQQHNSFVEFSVDEGATCGASLGINMQAAVYDAGFNSDNTQVLSTTLGNNGSCSVVNNCSPDASNTISTSNGLWFNPNRSGNGNDMYFIGNGLVYLQYTGLEDGSPIWYITDTATLEPMQNNQVKNTITKSRFNGPFLTSTQTITTVGSSLTTLISPNQAVQTRTINGKFSAELIQPFVFSGQSTTEQRSGLWYNPAESGWGATVATQGDTEFIINYLYDNNGLPYWLTALGGNEAVENMDVGYSTVFCPHCPAVNLETDIVGSMRVDYDISNTSATVEDVQIDVKSSDHPEHPSQWNRSNMPWSRLLSVED